jgi:hypothetical protein
MEFASEPIQLFALLLVTATMLEPAIMYLDIALNHTKLMDSPAMIPICAHKRMLAIQEFAMDQTQSTALLLINAMMLLIVNPQLELARPSTNSMEQTAMTRIPPLSWTNATLETALEITSNANH